MIAGSVLQLDCKDPCGNSIMLLVIAKRPRLAMCSGLMDVVGQPLVWNIEKTVPDLLYDNSEHPCDPGCCQKKDFSVDKTEEPHSTDAWNDSAEVKPHIQQECDRGCFRVNVCCVLFFAGDSGVL